jgi:hypothetical protein
MMATICVTLSLALFSLCGSDPTGRFHLGTLSICRPSAIMGPAFDTVAISRDLEGASCEELRWRVNSC